MLFFTSTTVRLLFTLCACIVRIKNGRNVISYFKRIVLIISTSLIIFFEKYLARNDIYLHFFVLYLLSTSLNISLIKKVHL